MSSIEILLPEGQLEGSEATFGAWLVAAGDAVTKDQPLCELETDKVTMEIAAPQDGVVTELCVAEGDQVGEGALLAWLGNGGATVDDSGITEVSAEPGVVVDTPVSVLEKPAPDMRLSPAVRRILSEHPVDLSLVSGTGKSGRVTKQDLLSHLASAPTASAQPVVASAPVTKTDMPVSPVASAVQTVAEAGRSHMPSELRPHSKMRQSIASHMVDSLLHTSPHVTSVFEADLTAISRHRAKHKDAFAKVGVKLSYSAYFIMAAAKALQAVPEVNSRFHADALEMFHDCNIGIGTALGNDGLVVPVMHRTQELNLQGIARRLQDMTDAAHNGTLKPVDMKDGTFTISNHGVSGSLLATPIIINQPQTAILGIGKMEKRVVVREVDGVDTMVIKPMSYITLTIDHRALDGYQTNKFLSILVDTLESWPLD